MNLERTFKGWRPESATRILLAVGDQEMRDVLTRALHKDGFGVVEVPDASGFLNLLGSYLLRMTTENYTLIIVDVAYLGLSVLEVIHTLHGDPGFPPLMVVLSSHSADAQKRARQLGSSAIFDTPLDVKKLCSKAQELVAS